MDDVTRVVFDIATFSHAVLLFPPFYFFFPQPSLWSRYAAARTRAHALPRESVQSLAEPVSG